LGESSLQAKKKNYEGDESGRIFHVRMGLVSARRWAKKIIFSTLLEFLGKTPALAHV
jgi:hypothetical protein